MKLDDFSINTWKVFWSIANGVIIQEKKQVLDDITIGLYLGKHPKLKEKYEEYGGYTTIENAKTYVKEENIDGYIQELKKWNTVIKLLKMKFPVANRLKDFVDMKVEDIYNEYEGIINHIFVNADSDVECHNLCENINKLIDKLDAGENVGMPLYNSPILNKEIGGNLDGNITLLGALSGEGKTTITFEWIVPQIIKYDEKLVIIINEQDVYDWRKQLIIWVANNIFKADFSKYRLRDGKFSQEEKELLKKCANWIEEKKDNKNITIIPLQRYKVNTVIKIIKKYASLGCKYFILDTFKLNTDIKTDSWLEMMYDSVKIYDVIKPSCKNVFMWMTYQLSISNTKTRYYTNDCIGKSKGIIEVASTNIMIRRPFDDEYEGGKRELTCYRLEGKQGKTRIPFKLKKDKYYTIIFIPKNRFGATGEFQIIAEHNLSKNTYTEIGICNVTQDF